MDLELESRANETAIWAYSVLAAIGQAFGAKNAIKKLLSGMRKGAGDTGLPMGELRRRLGSLLPVTETEDARKRRTGGV